MTTTKQVTVPADKLERLLLLSQLMLAVVEGMGEQNEKILTTRLKGILTSEQLDLMSAIIENFDSLVVAHLAHDLINSTSEVAEYLPDFKSNTVVELEVM